MLLFCLPFAGGTASSFYDWRTRSAGLEVCPIEYPGRGSRWNETACPTLQTLAEAITAELRPRLCPPYALLGHSFGAIVAFEVTRLIARLNLPLPVRLCISGARAPHLPPREAIHALGEPEFLSRLVAYGGMPPEALENRELLSLVIPIVRHDFRLFEQHVCDNGNPLCVPISVFGGLQDPAVPPTDLLAWRQYTTKSFRSRFYPGGHFFLYDPQLTVLRDLQDDIAASGVVAVTRSAE